MAENNTYFGVHRLIDRLEISSSEQKHMKTIIGTQEKYRRNNEKRTPRNENGLTKRQQDKEDRIESIKYLKKQSLSQSEVAKKLQIGIATVKRYWNIK
ncbi:MAG: hypothetical protein ACRC03_00485 [Romboutsia sp.]